LEVQSASVNSHAREINTTTAGFGVVLSGDKASGGKSSSKNVAAACDVSVVSRDDANWASAAGDTIAGAGVVVAQGNSVVGVRAVSNDYLEGHVQGSIGD